MNDSHLPELPSGWAWSTTAEACEKIQDGTHFSPQHQHPSGPYPYVTAKNVRPTGLDLADITYLDEATHRSIFERCDPALSDVLLVKDGVNAGDACLNTLEGQISLLSSVCFLRPKQSLIHGNYLRYFLLGPIGSRLLKGEMTGTAIRRIILQKVRSLPVPIAPLNHQNRIVAEIEKQFSRLDAGVAALKRVEINLRRYKASVLKAACEGRLTEAWRAAHPDVEPASKLLSRILAERRQRWEESELAKMRAKGTLPKDDRWKDRYEEPVAPKTNGLPELPSTWCWVATNQIGYVQLGRQRSPKNRSDKYPTKYIRAANITESGLALDDLLDMEFRPNERATYLLDVGDILLSEASGSANQAGKPAVWRGQIDGCCFQNTVIRLRPVIAASDYLLMVFKRYYGSGFFARMAAGGAGIHHLSAGKFAAVAVPLPPMEEQAAIIDSVENALSMSRTVEESAGISLHRASSLRQSILRDAFEGKLVEQDPTDEPASVLLDRIRKERQTDWPEAAPARRNVAGKDCIPRRSRRPHIRNK